MANEKKPLTTAEMAKLVKRTISTPKVSNGEVVKDKDGNVQMVDKQVAISPDEVISAKEYADKVVVVTEDGQKFEAALA